jgi:hypothetical protein
MAEEGYRQEEETDGKHDGRSKGITVHLVSKSGTVKSTTRFLRTVMANSATAISVSPLNIMPIIPFHEPSWLSDPHALSAGV